jgi:23S rRNA pseudouridine1911/1915/1917 synthase
VGKLKPFDMLYEDNHLLVAVKPPNMPVAADSSGDADMLSILKSYIKEKYNKPGNVYLGLVHRLDRPVGGVVCFAKTSKAAKRLAEQFVNRTAKKEYYAVVCGRAQSGEYEDYLVKDTKTNTSRVALPDAPGAKLARLFCETVAYINDMSLVKISLETGRPHQIRVQLASAGIPIWGDNRYNKNSRAGEQIALWAHKLTIEHPTRKDKLEFTAPLPERYPFNAFLLEKPSSRDVKQIRCCKNCQ